MLEVRDLRVRYPGGLLALDGVTLMAHPGDAVAVVGPNGSGKSTLLRAVIGLVPEQAGAVRFNGETLTGVPPHQRAARGIAYVADGAPVLQGLSVRENLAVGSWLRRDPNTIAGNLEEMLAMCPELRGQLRRKADALSAADRQLLAIARGVLSRPRLLLLDESLTGLDLHARGRVLSMLRKLRAEDLAVVFCEHDPATAREIAERAYGLLAGRLVFGGSTTALGHAPVFGGLY
jgi:branched-chain amino acid transport system ATP-binding protein